MPVEIASAPPSKPKANTSTAKTPAKTPASLANSRYEALAGLGAIAQVPLIAVKQYADAGAVGIHWPNVARELARLAETQEQVAQFIDPLIKIGPYTGLVTAVLPLVMQIAVNHGRVAAGAVGTVPGAMLASQIETAMAQQELESLKVQMEAEAAAARMKLDIEEQRATIAKAAG